MGIRNPKDQAQKRLVLFQSADEVQEVNLFQVRKLRREAKVETHTWLARIKSKVETFETFEIF
jgi:hypothetical protein